MAPSKSKSKSDVNTHFPISKILVKENIRDKGWDKRVDELATSIKQVGQVSPVLLMPLSKPIKGKTHELVYGFRRLAACRKLKFSTIKATFAPKDMTQKQKDAARLVENTDREDLSPIEEAKAYQGMMTAHKMSAKQVANVVGKTDGHVSQRLALLRMPKKVIDSVESGVITATHARQIHRIKDPKEQEKLVAKASTMTAKAFEEYIQNKLHPEKKGKKAAKTKSTPTEKHQPRQTALKALKRMDLAKAKTDDKVKKAHLNGVMRGISWALKLTKNAKLPV